MFIQFQVVSQGLALCLAQQVLNASTVLCCPRYLESQGDTMPWACRDGGCAMKLTPRPLYEHPLSASPPGPPEVLGPGPLFLNSEMPPPDLGPLTLPTAHRAVRRATC